MIDGFVVDDDETVVGVLELFYEMVANCDFKFRLSSQSVTSKNDNSATIHIVI